MFMISRLPGENSGHLCGLTGSVLDHRSPTPEFEHRHGHIWWVFHLWLRFIIFGGRSAHLANHVHKSGRKTSIIIIINHRHPSTNSHPAVTGVSYFSTELWLSHHHHHHVFDLTSAWAKLKKFQIASMFIIPNDGIYESIIGKLSYLF